MTFLSRPLLVLLLCSLVLALGWSPPRARAELIINEVLGDPNQDWDGDGQLNYKGDEWIEVLNEGGITEDLSNFWLRDAFGEAPHLQLFGSLDPGQTAVFYGSQAVQWQQDHGQTGIGFSINNSGDTLELLKTVVDQGDTLLVMVHQVTLSDHEVEDDRSSGWGTESGAWELFDALDPYNGSLDPPGNNCQPTPGQPNACVPLVPVQNLSWDQLKSRYR